MPVRPRIVVFAGSARPGAPSARVAAVAAKRLAILGADVTRLSLEDYPLPILDEEPEAGGGGPENAMKLARQFALQDGFLVATSEYNASLPPLLKNALDWVSRVKRDGVRALKPFEGKVAGLCSASSDGYAGIRALDHLRGVLIACGVEVVTPHCAVPRGAEAFDADGELRDDRAGKAMQAVCATLAERAAMLSARVDD